MTRKDYVLIADTIAGLVRDIANDEEDSTLTANRQLFLFGQWVGLQTIAHRLADQLHQDNHRFDRKRFIDACQLDAERLA
jgi:hypothetical protein